MVGVSIPTSRNSYQQEWRPLIVVFDEFLPGPIGPRFRAYGLGSGLIRPGSGLGIRNQGPNPPFQIPDTRPEPITGRVGPPQKTKKGWVSFGFGPTKSPKIHQARQPKPENLGPTQNLPFFQDLGSSWVSGGSMQARLRFKCFEDLQYRPILQCRFRAIRCAELQWCWLFPVFRFMVIGPFFQNGLRNSEHVVWSFHNVQLCWNAPVGGKCHPLCLI